MWFLIVFIFLNSFSCLSKGKGKIKSDYFSTIKRKKHIPNPPPNPKNEVYDFFEKKNIDYKDYLESDLDDNDYKTIKDLASSISDNSFKEIFGPGKYINQNNKLNKKKLNILKELIESASNPQKLTIKDLDEEKIKLLNEIKGNTQDNKIINQYFKFGKEAISKIANWKKKAKNNDEKKIIDDLVTGITEFSEKEIDKFDKDIDISKLAVFHNIVDKNYKNIQPKLCSPEDLKNFINTFNKIKNQDLEFISKIQMILYLKKSIIRASSPDFIKNCKIIYDKINENSLFQILLKNNEKVLKQLAKICNNKKYLNFFEFSEQPLNFEFKNKEYDYRNLEELDKNLNIIIGSKIDKNIIKYLRNKVEYLNHTAEILTTLKDNNIDIPKPTKNLGKSEDDFASEYLEKLEEVYKQYKPKL